MKSKNATFIFKRHKNDYFELDLKSKCHFCPRYSPTSGNAMNKYCLHLKQLQYWTQQHFAHTVGYFLSIASPPTVYSSPISGAILVQEIELVIKQPSDVKEYLGKFWNPSCSRYIDVSACADIRQCALGIERNCVCECELVNEACCEKLLWVLS